MIRQQKRRRNPRVPRLGVWLLALLAVAGAAWYFSRAERSAHRSDGGAAAAPGRSPALPTVNDLRSGAASSAIQAIGTPQGRTMSAVDLNTASLEELQTIPGISQAYAERIVAGRPYREMKELERTGIPQPVLRQISPPAIIRAAAAGPIASPSKAAPGIPSRPPKP